MASEHKDEQCRGGDQRWLGAGARMAAKPVMTVMMMVNGRNALLLAMLPIASLLVAINS